MTGNEKSIVESTLLQIKAVEDAISENAKGILASTMKEEISELVRESLNGSKKSKRSLHEQDEEGTETPEVDDEDLEGEEDEMDYDEMGSVDDETEYMDDETSYMDDEVDSDMEVSVDNDELPPLDMTQSPMSDVMKVFKAMGDEDGIIVKKDGKFLHISDNETDKEYIVQLEESKKRKMRNNLSEEILYELHFEDKEDSYVEEDMDMEMDMEMDMDMPKMSRRRREMEEMDMDMNMGYDNEEEDEDNDVFYELEMGDQDDELPKFEQDEDEDEMTPPMKEAFKPKGRVGKMKFKYPSKLKRGVAETSNEEEEDGDSWKEESNEDVLSPEDDKMGGEKSEAARTYGNGSKSGRGLRKAITPNRNMTYESTSKEMNLLKEKNEEYKKALDFFRNKLNEVAVFNSNLAYSTRLFTEHSTTKQEKINILRRFDDVDTLKESKNLYKSIKNELDGKGSNNVVKESISEKVNKTPQTGSSSNLIESKTYENPQFLRMKDLMTKIK